MADKIKSLADLKEVTKYLNRIGAEPRSMRTAVVKEKAGAYWRDIAVISVSKVGEIKCPPAFEPTEQEIALIIAECATAIWPEIVKTSKMINMPDMLKNADNDDLFIFRDDNSNIIMVQQRIENEETGKAYIPWTYWDDDEWRIMEPEGKLPLWGVDQLDNFTTVFIHEGAKAARKMRKMVAAETVQAKKELAAHPWGVELGAAAHVGWIGGALSPARTDWSALKRKGVKRVYIVSDNDDAGVAAVPSIAFQLRMPTFHVQFTQEWPATFDLGDDFPDSMFSKLGDEIHYTGPSFRSCIHPATWATDQVKNPSGKGKPTTVLRDEFKKMWGYIEEVDMFICIEMPEILRTEPVMNKILAGFSHINSTSSLMVRSYRGRKTKLCYRPDVKGRIVTDRTTSAVNMHTPTMVKSVRGNPKPWLDFMEYMFPVELERKGVEKWCATLIAKPGIRMEYGLLLVSETQGIGKTTLGAKILAPLVGDQNVGFPTEKEIVDSTFNSWLANKRLLVVNEIYSGHSWKAYNTLKSYITDKDIQVNEKYMRPYRIENWAHMIANSNSRRALKMEGDDRRWFYPKITEQPWSKAQFTEFNIWLNSGGLQIIHHWAKNYGEYVSVGDRAPMTSMKQDLIEESRSDAEKELADLCQAVALEGKAVCFAMKELVSWLRERVEGKIFDKNYELCKVASDYGFKTFGRRIKVGSQMQSIIVSPAFFEKHRKEIETNDENIINIIRSGIIHPTKLEEVTM